MKKKMTNLERQKDAIRERLDIEDSCLCYMDNERIIVYGNGLDIISLLGGFIDYLSKTFGTDKVKEVVDTIFETIEEEK